MKLLLVFITRVFLSCLAFLLFLGFLCISFVLFIEEPQLFFLQIEESLLKLTGIVLCGLGCWYIGKPQIKWWKKFLSTDE